MSGFDGFEVLLPALIGATGGEQKGLGFHQGIVTAWDSITGTNTITVAGNTFSDLRSLLGGESALIRPGDVVAILKYQTVYFVLGRITAVGSEQRSLGMATNMVFTSEGTASAPWVDLATVGPTVTAYIGSPRRCMVFTSVEISATQATGYMGFQVSGASTIGPNTFTPASLGSNTSGILGTPMMLAVVTAANGLNVGDNTFTAKYGAALTGGLEARFLSRRLTVIPF